MTDQQEPTFGSSTAQLYDRDLVPVLFASYARDLARRVGESAPDSVLEIAAGTGAVTRELSRGKAVSAAITATDLSQPMLDQAIAAGTDGPVEWRQADAMELPSEANTFEIVVSQFGMMFPPDKPRAFAEARRVLKPGGRLIFSVWDRIDANGFALAVHDALAARYPDDPPRFLVDGAYGYYDESRIRADLADGGFTSGVSVEALDVNGRGASPESIAIALCQGGPVLVEIEKREPDGVAAATAAVADLLQERYGSADLVAPMRALIISVSVA